MSAKACISYLRVTPRKARLVADLIRGKKVQAALDLLSFTNRYVAKDFKKLLRSALANAEQKGGMDPDNLIVKTVMVDQGPTIKRWQARARGSAYKIEKKTSHITLILEEK
ncbi:50S ribosomal protein L22 [Deltaproteobacteria bacterium PRO3]|nr:50S ribosomal protein L22 [Deltaproteobacteria bacterium]MDL1871147.1 50S ribosomal protein L22 [Deltaproteobacteria bacterium PRO3]